MCCSLRPVRWPDLDGRDLLHFWNLHGRKCLLLAVLVGDVFSFFGGGGKGGGAGVWVILFIDQLNRLHISRFTY